ncbi:presequence protease, mitochondrial [Plakobranchus ocellatus]|uniref:Presequence protease, mitochondrial n=1 Tax=Plakobranchus ocellatus TaxID=259542 RepID=A0AAV4A0K0_9GAST|nr:presequence protease, mitochondrial [Plakobranchus ocellatus]
MHILRKAKSASKFLKTISWSSSRSKRFLNEEARDRVRALKPGDKLHGYTVQKVEEVPDFFITAVMLTHDKTGAEHLHAARDDENNTFSVTFRTTPLDSTGVPHILEHTVLCGSEKFPVRDPFFKMLSRSMATFMNALTAYDWTMYPFSSQNEQDFTNLMSVYMDAAFSPLIRELDFCQEGWRLEQSDLTDPTSPIVFKGVVYNEMKGVFSNSQSLYLQEALNCLLPSHTYGVVSGGDPAHITSLTHQQLRDFHAKHYHPSNARFFTYGHLPLESHLQFINASLEKFSQISPSAKVPLEPRWKKPRSKHITCAPDPMAADPDKQHTVSVNFLMSEITDVYENFIASVLGYLLTNGETSPFYQALVESKLGSDYSPNTGFHSDTKEAIFAVGLMNVCEGDVDKVLKIIEETVDKVIEEGFDKTRINALLHQIELSQRHQGGNFGFHLALTLASTWNHEGDPVQSMQVGSIVERFREDIKQNPKLLQEKVKHYLKDNQHRLTLTMGPDSDFESKRTQEEESRLAKLVADLREKDKETIYQRGLDLQDQQNLKEDLSCLPSLKIDDLSKLIKPEPMEMNHAGWSFIQTCEQPTNGVTYLRQASSLEGLPEELMPYVPLFSEVITSIGAGGQDYLWMSQQQELYTGGLSASPLCVGHHTSSSRMQRGILFSSHCLEKNIKHMLDLWTHIINSPDFSDLSRLSTLIKMSASNLASGLADNGHRYAMASSAAGLDVLSQNHEVLFGLSQVQTMKKVAELDDISDVVYKLQTIADLVLDKSCLRLAVNATPTVMDRSVNGIKSYLNNIKGAAEMTSVFPEVEEIKAASHKTHYQLPFSVNFVSQSFPAVRYTHKDFAPLNVLATLMSRKFLHREIREKGGAYGSGAIISPGVFSFFSYRDPNSLATLDVFQRCVQWATSGEISGEDIDEAKLGVFQKIDKPVPPGSRGQTRFVYDISDDMRQANRDRLFSVSEEDVRRVASTYLNEESCPNGVAILGPTNATVREDEGWTVVSTEEAAEEKAQA